MCADITAAFFLQNQDFGEFSCSCASVLQILQPGTHLPAAVPRLLCSIVSLPPECCVQLSPVAPGWLSRTHYWVRLHGPSVPAECLSSLSEQGAGQRLASMCDTACWWSHQPHGGHWSRFGEQLGLCSVSLHCSACFLPSPKHTWQHTATSQKRL
jgi:hypothetical protein